MIACCRDPQGASALREMASEDRLLRIMKLDMGDPESIVQLGQTLESESLALDLLIQNAGTVGKSEKGLEGFSPATLMEVLQLNVTGPLALTQALHASLRRSKLGSKVFFLTSRTGALRRQTIDRQESPQFYYATSKSALHRAIPTLASNLWQDRIVVGGVDPGWVRTDMTRGASTAERYQIEPSESVAGMLETIERADIKSTGMLWRHNGEIASWYAPPETPEERQERSAAL